ncbi:MAG: MarR family transcriptional regulator [Nocardioides sp.]
MPESERERLLDAVTASSAALVAIAVRSVAAGRVPVTVSQHRVLVLLEQHGTLSVTALARHLGVDQSNASRHCSRLVRAGLVHRGRDAQDGRAVELRLTPAGRHQVRAVLAARRQEVERVLRGLPDAAVREVAGALELFRRAADQATEELDSVAAPPSRS